MLCKYNFFRSFKEVRKDFFADLFHQQSRKFLCNFYSTNSAEKISATKKIDSSAHAEILMQFYSANSAKKNSADKKLIHQRTRNFLCKFIQRILQKNFRQTKKIDSSARTEIFVQILFSEFCGKNFSDKKKLIHQHARKFLCKFIQRILRKKFSGQKNCFINARGNFCAILFDEFYDENFSGQKK
jgi:hypothetical protein